MNADIARDIVTKAWQSLHGRYDEDAKPEDAPERFSATSFIVWIYAGVGVRLEDDLLILHRSGFVVIGSGLEPADLIFRTGRRNVFHPDDVVHGVGHVGLYAGGGVVIHASARNGHVAPSSIDFFLDMEDGKYRGTRRILARC